MKRLDRKVEKEDGTEVEIFVRKPTNGDLGKAEKVRIKSWSSCKKDPDIMSKIQLNKFLEDRGIWNKEKESQKKSLEKEIIDLEKRLVKPGKKRVKLSEARSIAIEMRKKRKEYRDLISEKIELESNTIESIAENSRFDFLVTRCTFYKDSEERVYNNVEDYNNDDTNIPYVAAAALGQIMYNLTDSFESVLPENEFLVKQKLADPDTLALVNFDGDYVDEDFQVVLKKEDLKDEVKLEVEYENDLAPAKPKRKTTRTKTNTES